MKKLYKKMLTLGFGVATLTKQQVDKVVREAMKTQGISEYEAKRLAQATITQSMKTQQKVQSIVADAATRVLRTAGIATAQDIAELKRELHKKKKYKK